MVINRPYPIWPLPQDYEQLTEEGKRQARVAVCCDQSTPGKLVVAWDFFRRVYLAGEENTFYKDGVVESPEFHYWMVEALGTHALNAWAAPRGSAKSTVITLEVPLLLTVTRRGIDISLFFSTDKQKQPRFDTLMMQLENNATLINDFGKMRPRRGAATWNHEYLQLLNNSTISGGSVMGKMRGGRPNLLILDDPENDPDSNSEASQAILSEKFEVILFKKMLPMLKPGTQMFWIGTLINRKSFLFQATCGDDPRYDFWNRVVLRAISTDPDDETKCTLLWPGMWSKEFLDNQKQRLGPSAFASEYCNDPVSDQEKLLCVDARKNEYTVDGTFDWNNPLNHKGLVKWQERIIEPGKWVFLEKEKPFDELVRPMFRFMAFDYASGMSQYNDYACNVVFGLDSSNVLWILDVWLGRAKDDTLKRLIYEKGLAWRPRVIGIEAVSVQMSFAEAAQEYMLEMELAEPQPWRPRVFPVTYPSKVSKGQRIANMEWMYNAAKIKYPVHLANQWPYDQLYAQTSDFTMDLALLPHDDVIDTVAMHQYIVKRRGGAYKKEKGQPSLLDRIKRNKPLVPGTPLLSGVPLSHITDEMLDIMSQQARQNKMNPNNRRIERNRRTIIG